MYVCMHMALRRFPYMHACIHPSIHPSIHPFIHPYRQTDTDGQTDTQTHTHRHIHADISMYVYLYIYTRIMYISILFALELFQFAMARLSCTSQHLHQGSMDRKVPADPANPASQEVVEPQAGQVPRPSHRVSTFGKSVKFEFVTFTVFLCFIHMAAVGVVSWQRIQDGDSDPRFQSWWEPATDHFCQLAWVFRLAIASECARVSRAGWFPWACAEAVWYVCYPGTLPGGTRDMYQEVLKFGAQIVDALVEYKSPVFVYIPPGGELRGGSWVVIDPTINPEQMETWLVFWMSGGCHIFCFRSLEGICEDHFFALDDACRFHPRRCMRMWNHEVESWSHQALWRQVAFNS